MRHFGDITKLSGYTLPVVDVITGGSPCQDLSIAGARAGLSGERSGLFMEQIRLIKEMRSRDVRIAGSNQLVRLPRYAIWENVPGAFSSNGGKDFQAVLTEFARIAEPDAPDVPMPDNGKWPKSGCIYQKLGGWSIAWRVHDAQFWGVPQRRKRIALVADFGGLSAAEILFERKGLSRDPEQSEEARKGTAKATGRGADKTEPILLESNQNHATVQTDGVSTTLLASMGMGGGYVPMVASSAYSFDAMSSNSMKSSNPHSGCRAVEVAKTLDCFDPNPSKNQGGIAILSDEKKCFNQLSQSAVYKEDEVSTSITVSGGSYGGGSETLCLNDAPHALSFQERCGKPGGGKGILVQDERTGALSTTDNQRVLQVGCDVYNQEITGNIAASLTAACGGTNTSGAKVLQIDSPDSVFCLQGNGIDRADTAGCNGRGWCEDVSYTLNTIDRPAVCAGFDSHMGAKAGNIGYQEEQCPTLNESKEMSVYDARGNGDGDVCPTITGDHNSHISDYSAICIGNGQAHMASHITEEVSQTLNCMHDQLAVAFFQNTGQGWWNESEVGATLRTPCGGDSTKANLVTAVDCRNGSENEDTSGSLQSRASGNINSNNTCRQGKVVRRLTPLECERLQGFPDGWTDIGEWVDSKGKKHQSSDSPRYKALGNSIAVGYTNRQSGFWCWLARRICAQYERQVTMASLFDGIGGFPLAFSACGAIPVWASEIEEFPIAVTKARFPE